MAPQFYITISNGLLTEDHRKRMGAAVWEFMWCIDKVTRIEENGNGYVLGGKPIRLSDLAKQMGVREATVSEHLTILENEGYIQKTIHSHGISIVVLKAKKPFRKSVNHVSEKRKPPSENRKPLLIDNTVDNTERQAKPHSSLSFLEKVPSEVALELSTKYRISTAGVQSKATDLKFYCEGHGKRYKNYRAMLENALRKDAGILREKFPLPRPARAEEPEKPISKEQKERNEKKMEEIRNSLHGIAKEKTIV